MSYHKTEGFILKTLPYKEGDRLVTIYSRDKGLIHSIAKGSRKLKSRTCSLFENFYKSKFVLYRSPNRELFTVTQVSPINSHIKLREDIKIYSACCAISEVLTNYLEPEEKDIFIYNLIEHCVSRLEIGDEPLTVLRIFEFRFISHSGYKFKLSHCAKCRKPVRNPHYFSVTQGGVVCSLECAGRGETVRVGSGSIKFIDNVFSKPLNMLKNYKLSQSASKNIELLSRAIHRFYTGKSIKSVSFFK